MSVSSQPLSTIEFSDRYSPGSDSTRLWLDFVNTDAASQSTGKDLLRDFESLLSWLQLQCTADEERFAGIRRRASLQPAAAAASVVDARRVRAALRVLAERGRTSARVRDDSALELNRVLGRSAGTRRIDKLPDGAYARSFVPTGDAFAGLLIPIVESASDALVSGAIFRVKRCADSRCHRVFADRTRNGVRRWCDMGSCGNRAKAARRRANLSPSAPRNVPPIIA